MPNPDDVVADESGDDARKETETKAEICFVSTDGDEDGICCVTGEELARLFDPDLGKWYYEDAVRIDGKLMKASVANKDVS